MRAAVRLALLLSAFALALPAGAGACGRVTVAGMTWASASIIAHIEGLVLREGYGCDAEVVPGDTVPTATSMSERGEPDVAPEMWLNSAGAIIERAVGEGRLEITGAIFSDGAHEGWYIPSYMLEDHPGLTTLQAVRARPDLFPDKEEPDRGRFYGCPGGWACQIVNRNLFRAYGLDEAGFIHFDPGSGEGLAAAIARAHERREPVFAYYWRPSALLAQYPMTKLGGMEHDSGSWDCIVQPDCPDPAPNMYPPPVVHTVVTASFAERAPEAHAFVAQVSWPNEAVLDAIEWMRENQATPERAAERFLREREDVWTAWVPEGVADRVRAGVR